MQRSKFSFYWNLQLFFLTEDYTVEGYAITGLIRFEFLFIKICLISERI